MKGPIMTAGPRREEFEPRHFRLTVSQSCHGCGKTEECSVVKREWLSPYFVRQSDAWLQTALCPKCARWHLRFWIMRVMRWRIGRLSDVLAPGYGACARCHTNWHFCDGHSTTATNSSWGMFPLCEQCWSELTPELRLPYYRKLFDRWPRDEHQSWEALSDAVLAGF